MGTVAARTRRLLALSGLVFLASACHPDVFISVRRPVPPPGATFARTASIELADFTDARPDSERSLIGRSAETNLFGKYPDVIRTQDDVARVTTQAVRDDLERNGFAVLPAAPAAPEANANQVIVSGSVTRAWIDIRRGWGLSCTSTVAADIEVHGASGAAAHTYLVGQSQWSNALESPKQADYESMFQQALQDLATKVSAFVRQTVRPARGT